MIHINGPEDAEEMGHDLHRTSYDLKRAFDCVSKPVILLAWQRLGVPADVARWLTMMDIGGTTVVKTPYAQYLWQMLNVSKIARYNHSSQTCAPKDPCHWVRILSLIHI